MELAAGNERKDMKAKLIQRDSEGNIVKEWIVWHSEEGDHEFYYLSKDHVKSLVINYTNGTSSEWMKDGQ